MTFTCNAFNKNYDIKALFLADGDISLLKNQSKMYSFS